ILCGDLPEERCLANPVQSLARIRCDSRSVDVGSPEIILCLRVALFRCHPEPSHGLRSVLWDALPAQTHDSQRRLRQAITVVGSLAIPLFRFLPIAIDTGAIGIQSAQLIERTHLTLFRSALEPPQGFL